MDLAGAALVGLIKDLDIPEDLKKRLMHLAAS